MLGTQLAMPSVDLNASDDCNVTLLSVEVSRYKSLVTVAETVVIAIISSGIILSNIVNLIVLVSASAAMPWATRLFLINLSSSDLLVGLIACAPAVLPAATHRWTYGDVWCQISGITHGTSVTVSIWSISMIGLHRFALITHLVTHLVWPHGGPIFRRPRALRTMEDP